MTLHSLSTLEASVWKETFAFIASKDILLLPQQLHLWLIKEGPCPAHCKHLTVHCLPGHLPVSLYLYYLIHNNFITVCQRIWSSYIHKYSCFRFTYLFWPNHRFWFSKKVHMVKQCEINQIVINSAVIYRVTMTLIFILSVLCENSIKNVGK